MNRTSYTYGMWIHKISYLGANCGREVDFYCLINWCLICVVSALWQTTCYSIRYAAVILSCVLCNISHHHKEGSLAGLQRCRNEEVNDVSGRQASARPCALRAGRRIKKINQLFNRCHLQSRISPWLSETCTFMLTSSLSCSRHKEQWQGSQITKKKNQHSESAAEKTKKLGLNRLFFFSLRVVCVIGFSQRR